MSCRGPSSFRSPNQTVPELVGISPCEDAKQRRFPAARRAHDRDEFPQGDIKVDILKCGHHRSATTGQLADSPDADEIA
jgi:hypothetical protein